jgi:hypothetical protein
MTQTTILYRKLGSAIRVYEQAGFVTLDHERDDAKVSDAGGYAMVRHRQQLD